MRNAVSACVLTEPLGEAPAYNLTVDGRSDEIASDEGIKRLIERCTCGLSRHFDHVGNKRCWVGVGHHLRP